MVWGTSFKRKFSRDDFPMETPEICCLGLPCSEAQERSSSSLCLAFHRTTGRIEPVDYITMCKYTYIYVCVCVCVFSIIHLLICLSMYSCVYIFIYLSHRYLLLMSNFNEFMNFDQMLLVFVPKLGGLCFQVANEMLNALADMCVRFKHLFFLLIWSLGLEKKYLKQQQQTLHSLRTGVPWIVIDCISFIWNVGVSKNEGTPKSSILMVFFSCKPSILEYPNFWKPPYGGFVPPWMRHRGRKQPGCVSNLGS